MRLITLALIGAALLLAQDKQDKKEQNKSAAKKTDVRPPAPPAAAALPTVPDGAKEVEPNLYRYVDTQGKAWMYRKTPFGISKWEDKPAPPKKPETEADAVPVTITDLGDSVQFDKQTPFGISRTIRKKSELTDDEKALIEREAKRGATASKDAGKTTEKK